MANCSCLKSSWVLKIHLNNLWVSILPKIELFFKFFSFSSIVSPNILSKKSWLILPEGWVSSSSSYIWLPLSVLSLFELLLISLISSCLFLINLLARSKEELFVLLFFLAGLNYYYYFLLNSTYKNYIYYKARPWFHSKKEANSQNK